MAVSDWLFDLDRSKLDFHPRIITEQIRCVCSRNFLSGPSHPAAAFTTKRDAVPSSCNLVTSERREANAISWINHFELIKSTKNELSGDGSLVFKETTDGSSRLKSVKCFESKFVSVDQSVVGW
jgi:hypothetical protein